MVMLVRSLVALLCLMAVTTPALAAGEAPGVPGGKAITVYKSPTCGCCAGWAEYLRDNGFQVTVVDQNDLRPVKARYGVGRELQSCHTAVIDGYVVEGHVPVDDIWRLITEKPDAAGITAPGMPMMSPGMNSIEPQGYDVLLFGKGTKTSVYSRY